MSRVIRDISPNEAQFLVDSMRFRVIHIGPDSKNSEALNITRNSPKTVLVNGLVLLACSVQAIRFIWRYRSIMPRVRLRVTGSAAVARVSAEEHMANYRAARALLDKGRNAVSGRAFP